MFLREKKKSQFNKSSGSALKELKKKITKI